MSRLDLRDRLDRGREAAPAVLFALLLVGSVVAPAAVAAAQSQSQTFEKTVEGSPKIVALDTTDISEGTTFTLEVVTSPMPGGGSQLIYSQEHTVSGTPKRMVFNNGQAYENVTFRVSGVSSEPDIGPGSSFGQTKWRYGQMFLATGGDIGIGPAACDTIERVTKLTQPGYPPNDCSHTVPGSTTTNTSDLTENETKSQIHQAAATQAAAADNWHAMLDSRLEDTETAVLANHGRPAYIRALNNGASKTAAVQAAKENISQYYANLQRNIISQWNQQTANAEHHWKIARQENLMFQPSDSNSRMVEYVTASWGGSYGDNLGSLKINISGFGETTYTLENGTSVDLSTISVYQSTTSSGNFQEHYHTASPKTGYVNLSGAGDMFATGVMIPATNSLDKQRPMDFRRYENALSEIQTQAESARSEMQVVADNTFDQYEAGDINTSDLVTPAMIAGGYSPNDEFSGYAAATLANLGVSIPENYSQIGHMNVSFADGTTDRGLIVSQSNPPNGSFRIGTQYAPANISGAVWLIDSRDSEIRDIEQKFTITDARNTTGGNVTKVTIEKRTYETTSADELISLYQEIAADQAEINARLANMDSGGGGAWAGLPAANDLSNKQIAVGAVVVVGVGLLVGRD